jgi:predicted transglutaminase-like cysteine proteinase
MPFQAIKQLLLSATLLGATALSAIAAPAAKEYGNTLPPIGYVKFCLENEKDCQSGDAGSAKPGRTALSEDEWTLVYQVNTFVNNSIQPASDMELYGQPEYWTYPTTAGDCEDYLLLKKRNLEALGFAPNNLLITVVLDEKREGHAVLTLTTTEGDFILDNRRNSILPWDRTDYVFLKRQSSQDPRRWMALTKKEVTVPAGISSNE